jgi:hypothetical protein
VRGDFLFTVKPPARPPDHAQGPYRESKVGGPQGSTCDGFPSYDGAAPGVVCAVCAHLGSVRSGPGGRLKCPPPASCLQGKGF